MLMETMRIMGKLVPMILVNSSIIPILVKYSFLYLQGHYEQILLVFQKLENCAHELDFHWRA